MGSQLDPVMHEANLLAEADDLSDGIPTSERDRKIHDDRRFFGHPRALIPIFSLQMWERFSFYGMQTILGLYGYFSVADGGLGLSAGVAVGIVGAYGAAMYIFTVVAGWVADRLLGAERTLFYSAIVVMFGHISLALVHGIGGMLAALVLIGAGAGGVSATGATIVDTLYSRKDAARRESGFIVYYMAICIGGVIGPILTGLAQQTWGFHAGFGLAAVGMALGLAIYSTTRKSLPDKSHVIVDLLPRSKRWMLLVGAVPVVAAVALGIATGVMSLDSLSGWMTAVALTAVAGGFGLMLSSKKVGKEDRVRVVALIPVMISTVASFALSFQSLGVIMLYSDSRVDRMIGGWEMPTAWMSSVYTIFLIALAPAYAALWRKLGTKQPSSPMKIGLAPIFVGIGFLAFIPFANAAVTPLAWVAFALFVIAAGELLTGPTGYSLSTAVAPKAFKTQIVGLYSLSMALASTLSGLLGGFFDPENQTPYWIAMGILGVSVGVCQVLISGRLTNMLKLPA